MKKFLNHFYVLILCILFTGCFQTNKSVNLKEYKEIILDYWMINPINIKSQLSSDGKNIFVANAVFMDPTDFKIVSTINKKEIIKPYNNVKPKGSFFGFDSWSPNGKAFIIRSSDSLSRCADKRLIIYKIINSEIVTPFIFEDGYEPCSHSVWSQNGKEVIIHKNSRNITKIDVYTNEIKKILLNISENERLVDIFWTEEDFFFVVSKQISPEKWVYELRVTNLNNLDYNQFIYSSNNLINLIYSDKQNLLFFDKIQNSPPKTQIVKWDRSTQNGTLVFQYSGLFLFSFPNHSGSNIAFFAESLNREKHLLILNSQNERIIDKGQISNLIGWNDIFDGLLVINEQEKEPKVEIIKIE